ncbi:hypothetical protein [Shewanella waksmanii]|uniref:hypothetical protein n=1 Tax=Shewanella waksmanii TaxID=213783 RepID=UPI003736D2EB
MRLALAICWIGVTLSCTVNASEVATCNQDINSATCQHYLAGVVDGALMYKPSATGARIESDSYQSRALKYRSGKRFQQANRTYCESRIPDRAVLVSGLMDAFQSGSVNTVDDLNHAMYSLLDCQRLK